MSKMFNFNRWAEKLYNQGKTVWLGFYDAPNGRVHLAEDQGEYFLLVQDGASEFFASQQPKRLTADQAKEALARSLSYKEYTEALERLGLSSESNPEEYDVLRHKHTFNIGRWE